MATPSEGGSRRLKTTASDKKFSFTDYPSPYATPIHYAHRPRRKPPKAFFNCCFTSAIDDKLEQDSISSFQKQPGWSFRKKTRDPNVVAVEDMADTIPEQNQTIHTSVAEIIAEEDESGGGSGTAPFDAQSNSLAVVPIGKIEAISKQDQSGGGSTTSAVSNTHVQTNSVAIVTDGRTERIPEQDLSNSLVVVPDDTTYIMPKEDQSSGGLRTSLSNAPIQSNSLLMVPYVGDKQISADESELQTLQNMAAEELQVRPKCGEIYEAITVDVGRIKKRLKDLSVNANKEGETAKNINTLDEGIEISDAASFLKLSRASSSEIEMAGLKAQRAAVLMFQAQVMTTKASQLLAESKQILQSTDI